MIIQCINCNKKFEVNSELIPEKGRTIQCGACNHVWFYKKDQIQLQFTKPKNYVEVDETSQNTQIVKPSHPKKDKIKKKPITKGSEIVKYKPKSNFTLERLLSYIIVIIITFIGIILVIDTFKSKLFELFPKLEFFLFNLYETLKDIQLFIKDLI